MVISSKVCGSLPWCAEYRKGDERSSDVSSRSEAADPGSRSEAADPGSRSEAADPGSRSEAADPGSRSEAADPGSRSEAADPGNSVRQDRSEHVTTPSSFYVPKIAALSAPLLRHLVPRSLHDPKTPVAHEVEWGGG